MRNKKTSTAALGSVHEGLSPICGTFRVTLPAQGGRDGSVLRRVPRRTPWAKSLESEK